MQDQLFTERKNIKLNLSFPSRLNEDLRRKEEMECIYMNLTLIHI
ncbi:Arc family DNA-binding protein [Escherichia coli]|nr:Arc family DNA-binding protein [Escherichia coli]